MGDSDDDLDFAAFEDDEGDDVSTNISGNLAAVRLPRKSRERPILPCFVGELCRAPLSTPSRAARRLSACRRAWSIKVTWMRDA